MPSDLNHQSFVYLFVSKHQLRCCRISDLACVTTCDLIKYGSISAECFLGIEDQVY